MIALSDARKITGRNTETGKHELNILESKNLALNPYSFIGIINYLLILDMIGEIFRINTIAINKNKTSNIYKALKQFASSMDDKDIDTIIALRNSLAHNYGLINIPINKKEIPAKQHKFTISNSETSVLIEYPSTGIWRGDFLDKSENSSTIISYKGVVDLVEHVYFTLKSECEKGSLVLALKKDIQELKARFTIII